MKKIIIMLSCALMIAGCSQSDKGLSMRTAKEEISWKNSIIGFRTGMAPGANPQFDAYITKQDGKNIQMPHDKYGLGYGASCPIGTSGLYKPGTGFSTAELLGKTDDKIVIRLHHDAWEVVGETVTLDKQVTLFRDSPIMSVIDYYNGHFEMLNVAAGLTTGFVGEVTETGNGYIVEYPSLGITAIMVMPDAEQLSKSEGLGCVYAKKAVTRNESLRYYIGLSDKGKEYLLDELAKIL